MVDHFRSNRKKSSLFFLPELIKSTSRRKTGNSCTYVMNRRVALGTWLREISIKDVGSLFFHVVPSFHLIFTHVRTPSCCLSSTTESPGASNGVPSTIAALFSLPASLSGLSPPVFGWLGSPRNASTVPEERESVAVPTPGNRHRRKYNIGR